MSLPRLAFVTALLLGPASAAAEDGWIATAEAPAAMALSAPQSEWFGAGTLPSAAIYRSFGRRLLGGARLRAGFLTSGGDAGEVDGMAIDDKRTGGLGSLTIAGRVRPLADDGRLGTGPWLEVGAGAALTGRDVRPTAELGVGWGFAAGPIDLGPSLRYVHVVQPDDHLSSADARIVLVGIEIGLLDRDRARSQRLVVRAQPVRPRGVRAEPAFAADRDADRILDVDKACPLHEVPAGDGDGEALGCPRHALFTVVEDRIALEERVLFDTGRARVRRGGLVVLAAIAAHLAANPEFERVEIEGHADQRGSDDYNLGLSALRAQRVRAQLVKLGVGATIEASGFGEARPRKAGAGERAWRQNRRVELVLVRRREVPATRPAVDVTATVEGLR